MKKSIMAGFAALMLITVPAMAQDDAGEKSGKRYGGSMFEHLDTDGTGSVTKAEFLSLHEQRFDKMDADGDGVLTREEFTAHMQAKREKMKEYRAQRGERGEYRGGRRGGGETAPEAVQE